jgi:hypothetical protein
MKQTVGTHDTLSGHDQDRAGPLERIGRTWDRRLEELGARATQRRLGLVAAGRRTRSSGTEAGETRSRGPVRSSRQDAAEAAEHESSDEGAEPGSPTNLMEMTTMHDSETALAREAILRVAREHDPYRWTSFDLRTAASYGGNHGALGIALVELIAEGYLQQSQDDKRISLPQTATVAR